MPSPSRVLLASGCLVLVLAGCSEDDPAPEIDPGDSSSAAATPTSAPSPSGPVEPTLPVAAQGDDAAAAEAFVRFYWETVNYAQATGDVEGLRELATRGCQQCRGGLQSIETTYAAGGRIVGGDMQVTRASAVSLSVSPGAFGVKVEARSSQQVITLPGGSDEELGGGSIRFDFVVERHQDGWRVARWDALT